MYEAQWAAKEFLYKYILKCSNFAIRTGNTVLDAEVRVHMEKLIEKLKEKYPLGGIKRPNAVKYEVRLKRYLASEGWEDCFFQAVVVSQPTTPRARMFASLTFTIKS